MKSDDIRDERVLAVRRKIAGETLQLLAIALFIAILIQKFILKAPPAQYMVEWALLVVAASYLLLRSFAEGVSPFPLKGQKEVVIFSLAVGAILAFIIKVALDALIYGPEKMVKMAQPGWIFIVAFICGSILSFIWLQSIYLKDKRKREQMDNYDDGSDEIC